MFSKRHTLTSFTVLLRVPVPKGTQARQAQLILQALRSVSHQVQVRTQALALAQSLPHLRLVTQKAQARLRSSQARRQTQVLALARQAHKALPVRWGSAKVQAHPKVSHLQV